MQKALFQETLAEGKVRCLLCPRHCVIAPGQRGYCMVRKNENGILYAETYGHPAAVQIDPIEKKPFNCFMPHTNAFSVGTFGCNLGCVFCQNDHLSRGTCRENMEFIEPERIVHAALEHRCGSVALTYNEPTVFIEYGIEIAALARKAGLKTLLVSNGYISRGAAELFYPLIDAANFDMKGFSEEFYSSMCSASLAPVLESIRFFLELGGHAELTNLLIPGKNDPMEMIDRYLDWVLTAGNENTPLHFSAYFPACQLTIPPTPRETVTAVCDHAKKRGFRNVFAGNIR